MSKPQHGWQLRFKWAVNSGIQHPEYTFDPMESRARAVQVALIRWPRVERDMTLIEICARRLPDGEWERLLPEETASCELPPRAADDEPS